MFSKCLQYYKFVLHDEVRLILLITVQEKLLLKDKHFMNSMHVSVMVICRSAAGFEP